MSMVIGSLEFTINRLTISVSATCSSWECGSPASLACFPVKLILMPSYRDNPIGFGRVRTESLHRLRLDYPALLCGLAPRPLPAIALSPCVKLVAACCGAYWYGAA